MFKNYQIVFSLLILIVGLSSCDSKINQSCTEVDVSPFLGNYNVSESCQQGFGHNVTFATVNPGFSASNNQIIFTNFNNTGQDVEAYVDCNGTYFRIPDQNLGSTAYTVAGEGDLVNLNGYIQLQFRVQSNEYGQANYCTYTYSR